MKTKIFSVILMILSLFFITSCDEESSTPDCEEYNYGTVIVKNNTGGSIYVDVTWGSSNYNDERRISSGGQTTYYRVSAGNIKIWGSKTGEYWQSRSQTLYSCQELTFTWYPTKSSNSGLWFEVSDGDNVIKTIYDLDFSKKE